MSDCNQPCHAGPPDDDQRAAFGACLVVMLLCLAIKLLSGCATGPAATRTVAQQRAAAVEVAVACSSPGTVLGIDETEWMQVGSGTLIDDRHVLTARHVVDCNPQAVLVVTANGEQIGAQVEVLAPLSDLARLELRESVRTAVPVVGYARPRSVVCIAVAYPRRARWCGPVSQTRTAAMQDLGVGLPTSPGHSGSALYDQAGRLVGIVTHKCASKRCTYATSMRGRAWILVTP